MSAIGRAVPHESARGHVTGHANYTDDLLARYPQALHAWPVLAPHAHARVVALDPAAALDEPGVVSVLTADDVPGEGDSGASRHDEPLFPREVLFHQQPVAWVLGETLAAAQRGAARVAVVYEPLPAIVTIEEAIAAGSFLTESFRLRRGDVSAIASSACVIKGELAIGGQEHFYLETNAALASLDEHGGMSVQSSTQHPAETQVIVARVLGLPTSAVTVACVRMGGAFGGKEVQANAFAAIAALGTWKTRRPVRVRLTRALDMAITGKRHPYLARYEAGLSVDGRIEALRLELFSDGGWSLDLSEPVMWRSLFHCDNAYFLPAVDAVGRVCRTNKTSQTAFRGFGGPQGMLVIEEILSHAARRLSIPPDVIRERNFYRPGQTTHYGQEVAGADRMLRIWERLKVSSEFSRRRAEIDTVNAVQPHTKRGLAMTPVKFGISFTATFFNQAGSLVIVYRDGSVQVNHGGTEMGQGLHTKIQQIAADGLGIDLAQVRVMTTTTDKVPNTSATAASAGTDLNGAAVADACEQIRVRLRPVAAGLLRVDPSTVHFADGAARAGEAAVPFAQVCNAAYMQRVCLFAQGFYRTPDIHYARTTGQGRPFYYYAFGAAVSEVEVDGFTGHYRLLRTDILHDVGESVSPVVDRGQVEGGFIQGVGWLTLEDLRWDTTGRLATHSASTYKLPSWSEVPNVFNVELFTEPNPGVVGSSKAVGEPPLMLAFSVREALRDAVAAFGSTDAAHPTRASGASGAHDPSDVVMLASPAIPEAVFAAIQRVRVMRSVAP